MSHPSDSPDLPNHALSADTASASFMSCEDVSSSIPCTNVLAAILQEMGASELLPNFIRHQEDDQGLDALSRYIPEKLVQKFGFSLDTAAVFSEKCRFETTGSAPQAAMAASLKQLGFDDIEVLERGGYGVVFKCRSLADKRVVAVKFIHNPKIRPKDAIREGQRLMNCDHENIVRMHKVHQLGAGKCALEMEFVSGGNLRKHLLSGRRLSSDTVVRFARQLLHALRYLHDEKSWLHGDIKPENILLKCQTVHLGGSHFNYSEASVVLVDFGLSKTFGEGHARGGGDGAQKQRMQLAGSELGLVLSNATVTGEWKGSHWYSSPEALRGGINRSPADDIWSACLVILEMATGINLMQLMNSPGSVRVDELPHKSYPSLIALLYWGLIADTNSRCRSARDLLRILDASSDQHFEWQQYDGTNFIPVDAAAAFYLEHLGMLSQSTELVTLPSSSCSNMIYDIQEIKKNACDFGRLILRGDNRPIRRVLKESILSGGPGVCIPIWQQRPVDGKEWVQCGPAECAQLEAKFRRSDFRDSSPLNRRILLQSSSLDDGQIPFPFKAEPQIFRAPGPDVDMLNARVHDSLPEWDVAEMSQVVNQALWTKYASYRHRIACYCNGDPNERLLFHFCPDDVIPKIWEQGDGHDPRMSKWTEVGKGAYFSEHPIYGYAYKYKLYPSPPFDWTLEDEPPIGASIQMFASLVTLGRIADMGPGCKSCPSLRWAEWKKEFQAFQDPIKPPLIILSDDDATRRNLLNLTRQNSPRHDSVTSTEGDLFTHSDYSTTTPSGHKIADVMHPRLKARAREWGKQFVVFDTAASYPMFLVTLKKVRQSSEDTSLLRQNGYPTSAVLSYDASENKSKPPVVPALANASVPTASIRSAMMKSSEPGLVLGSLSLPFSDRSRNRVNFFRSTSNVLAELNNIPDNMFGRAIEAKFPQVFVFGDQSCGKSKLLNAMIQLDLFPSNSTQCTVRPTFFIREFCNCANIEAKVEYKMTESGRVQTAVPRVFNLEDEGAIAGLKSFLHDLQSVALVMDILRASSHSPQGLSTTQDTFKLSSWNDTTIYIVLKVPLSKSEGNSLEFLQFVDLPGLQAVNPSVGNTLDYNELVIPLDIVRTIIESNSVEHQAWFTAPWFTYLTLQFLKNPCALGIHCISSQTALPGNVRSVNIMNRLKAQNPLLSTTILLSTTVEVWTMADFHCPKLTPPHPWVEHFRTRQHELFKNIWIRSFFVGAFATHSRSGRDYPLTYKCLSNGKGEITKQELIDEGSQIVELFAEVDDEYGILKRLGPFSLLHKCIAFIDDNFNEMYVQTFLADCHVAIRDLQAYNKQQAEVYPISKHGDRDPQVLHLWVKRVVDSSLVWMCSGNRDIPGVGTLPVYKGINWRKKVAEFQQSNLRHCLSRDLRPEFLRNANVPFCEQIDFVTGTFPNFTLSDGLIQSEIKTFRGVSDSDHEDTVKTPLDHIWGSMRRRGYGNIFQHAVSIESSAHQTVRKMLSRLTKRNSDGELGIFSPSRDVRDYICDEWWYSFKKSVDSLFVQICGSLIQNVREHMTSGQFYFPIDTQFPEQILFGNESYRTLYGIFETKLMDTLKEEWKEALNIEYEKIACASLPDNADLLTKNQEVLSKLCCTNSKPADDTVSSRFEQVIEAITGILSSWEEVQFSSEETRAPVSEVVTANDNSAPRVDLPNFTALCNSKHHGTKSSGTKSSGDILESFGAQIAAAPISGCPSIVNLIRDQIQCLLDVTASSDSKPSTWEHVPRIVELRKHLSVPVQRFDAGSAVCTRAVVPSIRIAVQDPKYHFIIPSDHYTDVSLRWCLKVSYENWPIQKPPRVIFRSLHDFQSLWREMNSLGNIDCGSDSLPRNAAFLGSHMYHHLEFMKDSQSKLQTALTTMCDTVARMSSEACKQSLERWLEFNHSQELYSDSEILKHKQAQFSESVCAFWQEVKSCSFQNSRSALHELQQCVTTEAVLSPFAEAVGQVEALKTSIGSHKTLSQVRDQDVFDHYSVMKTLQNWRQHNRSAYANFMREMRSTLCTTTERHQTEEHANPTRRDFKLEAQCIASIELAQSFMQSTCFRLYSVSFTVLENQLGTNVVPTILNVRDKVFRHLQEIQGDIDAGNFRKVLDQYPGLACPVVTENNMRIAAESIEKLRKISASINY